MRILIVEDDFVSRKVLCKLLSGYGECDVAVNGKEAQLAIESAWGSQLPYQLVCLDINMPELDGHSVLRWLRNEEDKRGIQLGDREHAANVIMVAGSEDAQDILGSVRAGCEGYVPKPIDPHRLRKTLQELGIIETPEHPR